MCYIIYSKFIWWTRHIRCIDLTVPGDSIQMTEVKGNKCPSFKVYSEPYNVWSLWSSNGIRNQCCGQINNNCPIQRCWICSLIIMLEIHAQTWHYSLSLVVYVVWQNWKTDIKGNPCANRGLSWLMFKHWAPRAGSMYRGLDAFQTLRSALSVRRVKSSLLPWWCSRSSCRSVLSGFCDVVDLLSFLF